jgi:hypothetical protein
MRANDQIIALPVTMLLFTGPWQPSDYAVMADRGLFFATIRASQYEPPTPNLFPAVSCTSLEETAGSGLHPEVFQILSRSALCARHHPLPYNSQSL